ncbi:ABC transporter permease [Massilia sp. MS-15]|uniref:ABC transporter permease n=1 Tax=Massilia sp. MS-15 TaxID=2878200 RepID=UPI001CD3FFEE|nr:ABC transporter permease [Massilia sp. MS-15]MCA1247573.1 ABC transporter permease [Massilia sp. MS-15]
MTLSGAIQSSLRREWRRLRADPWDAAMLTAIPLALYLLTWWIFSAGVARDLPLVVHDRDQSAISRSLIRMLDAAPGLKVVRAVNSEAEAFTMIRARAAFGIVSIPADLQEALRSGQGAKVQWAYNAQFAAHAGAMTRDVRTVVSTLSAGIELQGRASRGAGPGQAMEQVEPVRLRATTLFNENGSYIPSLAMPVAFTLLHIFVTLAAVTALGRELRAATVADWLAAAGGRLGPALLGKLLIPFAVFAVHALLLLVLFGAVLGWPVRGSATAILAATALFIAAYLAIGAAIVALTSSLRSALSACAFVTAPAFAFAGQGFPLLAMPIGARIWAEALPLTHYLKLLNNTWMAGAPLHAGLGTIAVLLAFVVVLGAAARMRLARRVTQPASWGKA